MAKHYKALAISLLAVVLAVILAFLLRLNITPELHLKYESEISRYAAQYGLEEALVQAVIRVESDFNPEARSPAGACGLMQITEETLHWAMMREGSAADYSAEDLYDPTVNIRYGCLILSLLTEEFADFDTVLTAYNAGRSNALKWLKDSRYSQDGVHISSTPFQETNQYIQKVNRYYEKYLKIKGGSSS